jgi:RNA polymerase sigma-70 factor (ECF subfamily)
MTVGGELEDRAAIEAAVAADVAMSRYAEGDDRQFAAVYDVIAPRLELYLKRRLRNPATVDDIIQQTFLQMHAKRGTFRKGAQVLPWALCIARNFMIDAVRKRKREAPIDDLFDPDAVSEGLVSTIARGDEVVEAHQTKERIIAVFGRLTERQRAAFELTKCDGLPQAEAAQVLGTTVMGIKQCVHKVYEKLQRAFEDGDRAVERVVAVVPATVDRP